MKIDQIAFNTKNPLALMTTFQAMGLTEWHHDVVKASGEVYGNFASNRAELHFNYQLGIELEILHYQEGDNWLRGGREKDLSHLGCHIETEEEVNAIKEKMKGLGIGIAQEVYTTSHTNPVIAGKRKYHYVIFASKPFIGFDLKIIRRINL
jgi:hypothetical protein